MKSTPAVDPTQENQVGLTFSLTESNPFTFYMLVSGINVRSHGLNYYYYYHFYYFYFGKLVSNIGLIHISADNLLVIYYYYY